MPERQSRSIPAKQIYLSLTWFGLLAEGIFLALAGHSGAFSAQGIVPTPFLILVAPATLAFIIISGFLFSWWYANLHQGVPCSYEMRPVSMGHAVCIGSIILTSVALLIVNQMDLYVFFLTIGPLVGQVGVAIGLAYYYLHRRQFPSIECRN